MGRAEACQPAVTRLLKLAPKIGRFRRARGQNAAQWGRHRGVGEGVSLLEPRLVPCSRKAREMRSALPAAPPCELCRCRAEKPGDVGKQVVSPHSSSSAVPRGLSVSPAQTVRVGVSNRVASSGSHRHLCFPTFLANGVWKSVGILALIRATMNFSFYFLL